MKVMNGLNLNKIKDSGNRFKTNAPLIDGLSQERP